MADSIIASNDKRQGGGCGCCFRHGCLRRLRGGGVSAVELVSGVSRRQPGSVLFDAEISPDGNRLGWSQRAMAAVSGAWSSSSRGSKAPQRVSAITGFVEAPALSPDGRALYYHKLEGGRFVIYRVAR
jgi:hypothetical protein